MRIGIDVDGVLTDICRWQLDCVSKYAYEHNLSGIVDANKQETYEICNLDSKIDDDFWSKYLYDYITNEPARKFASEVIKKLKEDGHYICIITARYLTTDDTKEGEEMRNILKKWLKDNDIYYDNIVYTNEDKVPYCKSNNIDIMIEDSPRNIMAISKFIPVICFDSRYNQNFKCDNIIHAYSWYDIYVKISNLKI